MDNFEDRTPYFEYREHIHDKYIRYSASYYKNTFTSLQSITSFILYSTSDLSVVDDVMVYIALGVEAMKRGEILSCVKSTLVKYIEENIIDSIKNLLPMDEYLAMKEDIEQFRLFPPDSLTVIPDFK